jgi:hypothetical protein
MRRARRASSSWRRCSRSSRSERSKSTRSGRPRARADRRAACIHATSGSPIGLLAGSYALGVAVAAGIASADRQFEGSEFGYLDGLGRSVGSTHHPTDCADVHAGLAFIPIVGDLVGSALATSCTYGIYDHGALVDTGTNGSIAPLIGSVIFTLGQVVGLVLVLVGLDMTTDAVRIDEPHASLELELGLDPSGSSSLTLRF